MSVMACVPPRAGFESARKLPTAEGVPLSHCKMKQLLARSSMWHRTCREWPPAWNVRSMVSQAVVTEEMEAIEASETSEKKAVHRQRWQAHETMALIAAKKQQELMGMKSIESAGIEAKKTKNKWKEVEALCREKGVERSAQQCQTRWSRLLSAFTQIRSWEKTRKPEQPSFWSFKLDERKTMGFLLSLDQKMYGALSEMFNTETDAIEKVLVNNNVVEVAELASVNLMPHEVHGKKYNADEADVIFNHVQGMSDEINSKTNSHSSSYQSDEMAHTKNLRISKPNIEEIFERDIRDADYDFHLEELGETRHEKHVGQYKAIENTNILREFLQRAMDDTNEGQLPRVSIEKTGLKPTVLSTGQQVEGLEVSGIADHSNPLVLCDQLNVDGKAQPLPASAEMIDSSNKESCVVPLVAVNVCDKPQLLHASAENVDCNPSNLHTGAESSQCMGTGDHLIPKRGGDQRDVYDKTELLPVSVEMIDGRNMDLWQSSLEEHGAEGKTFVMHEDDDNVPFSDVMYDEIVQAAQDECIEKGADGIRFQTNDSVIDSLAEEGIASVSAPVEEFCMCQKSEGQLSFLGVDVLNANQSTQTTPLSTQTTPSSHISADKEDCQSYSVGTMLVEEVWVGKNAEGEGGKVNSFTCLGNAEDISFASADNSQPYLIESKNENEACQMFELQGKLDPVLDFKEDICTGISKQGPENDSTFPGRKNIESTCCDQDKGSEKFKLLPPEERHAEMIADVFERNAVTLEYGARHSFEAKKAERLQMGNTEANEKTGEPCHRMNRFALEKDVDISVKSEWCNQKQSDHRKDGNDAFEKSNVTTEEHVPEQSTMKGDVRSCESVSKASRVEVAANELTKLDFKIVKDERGTPVTAENGSTEDRIQKTGPADEDVFMNIPAATGSFVKSAVQTIRKFFNF